MPVADGFGRKRACQPLCMSSRHHEVDARIDEIIHGRSARRPRCKDAAINAVTGEQIDPFGYPVRIDSTRIFFGVAIGVMLLSRQKANSGWHSITRSRRPEFNCSSRSISLILQKR
jgi:hypothetical protein